MNLGVRPSLVCAEGFTFCARALVIPNAPIRDNNEMAIRSHKSFIRTSFIKGLEQNPVQIEVNIGSIGELSVWCLRTARKDIEPGGDLGLVVYRVRDLRLYPPVLELQLVKREQRRIEVVARAPGLIQVHRQQAVVSAAHA